MKISLIFILAARLVLGSAASVEEKLGKLPLDHPGTKVSKSQKVTSLDQVPEGLGKSDWSSIRAAYDAGRHAFQPVEGGWQARNPGQQWTTKFDGRGFLAQPKDTDWQWGLEFKNYGFGEQQTEVGGTPAVRNEGQRLTYQWNDSVQEWFVNDTRGLEHGFTITRRPDADGGLSTSGTPLSFTLATRGTLRPTVSSDALTVHFRDASNAPVLNYSSLKVWDADGKVLASRFEAAGENQVRLLVEESGACYPLTIDPIAQQAYLKTGNNGPPTSDNFGISVAVSGDTVVIGSSNEGSNTTGVNSTSDENAPGAGAAYVFVRSGATWSEQAYLKASNTGAGDQFGTSVAVSANTIVVGASGEDSSSTGIGSVSNELAEDAGAAYVFVRIGAIWSQQAYLKSSNTGASDGFGSSVSISSDTVVVGALKEDAEYEYAPDSGAAYVFLRTGTAWSQQAYLKASNMGYLPQFGTRDLFGCSVAVSAETIIVGASGEKSNKTGVNRPLGQFDSPSIGAGAAYVFVRSGITWSQQAYLKASNTGAGDSFGTSVAVAGDSVVVGAPGEASNTAGVNAFTNELAPYSGASYVFSRSGTTWSQQSFLKASNPGSNDNFGSSVSISGDTIAIGAAEEDSSTTNIDSLPNEGAANAGASYVFVRSGATWNQQAYLKASNAEKQDFFGRSVAISGEAIIVGAHLEDGNATGVNHLSNELAYSSGASYVYVRTGSAWSQQSYIKASNTPSRSSGAGDRFGFSVAFSGDTVVIGVPGEDGGTMGVNSARDGLVENSGATFIYVQSGTAWIQQAYLKASSISENDNFGSAVAISGDAVVVGVPYEDSNTIGIDGMPNELAIDSGAAYVFVRNGSAWTQQAYLKAGNTGVNDEFGSAVAISGDKLVVGSKREDSSTTGVDSIPNELKPDSGAAYIFGRSGPTWNQQAYLKASTNTGNYDNFGRTVAISGDTVAVAGIKGVHVFAASGGFWSQQVDLEASAIGSDSFGSSIAISGDTMVIGAPSEDKMTTYNQLFGAAYVFVRNGTIWNQQAHLNASNYGWSDQFGESVAISGNSIVIGARHEDSSSTGVNSMSNNSAADSGAAYVFIRNGTTWSETAYLKAQNTGAGDFFGHSVAISGGSVVVGAYQEDSSTTGIASIPDDITPDSGASYVFSGFESPATEPIVSTSLFTNVSSASVNLSGSVADDGGSSVSGRGFVYSVTSSNSSSAIGGQGVVQIPAGGVTGAFVVLAAGLSSGTNYTFKAYATNSVGTGYSTSSNFTTLREFLVTFDPGNHGGRTGGALLIQHIIQDSSALAPVITSNIGWTFSGWDTAFDRITSNLTVTALYAPVSYTVAFVLGSNSVQSGGGTLLQTIHHGNPALAPVINANVGWTFSGWDTAFDSITSNLTVTALYAPVAHAVTFVLGTNGTQSGGGAISQTIQHGNPAMAPTVVANAGWQFTGWSSTFGNVTSDLEITAIYVVSPPFTVTFGLGPNGYGTRIGGGELVQSVIHGSSAVSPQISPASGQRFVGWNQSLINITGNIIITAVYQAYAVCTVTFDLGIKGTRAGGGALIQVIEQPHAAVAPVVTTDVSWVFVGWDLPFNSIVSNLTITALYAPAIHVVTFDLGTKGSRSGGGALSQNVAYLGAAVPPVITASLGWTFVGWDLPFASITGDVLIRAIYEAADYIDTFDPAANSSLWALFEGEVSANTYGQAAGIGSSGKSLWFNGSSTRAATTVPLDLTGSSVIRFKIALGNGLTSSWENVDIDEGEGIIVEYSVYGLSFTTLGGPFVNKTWQEVSLSLPQAAKTNTTRFRFRQLLHSGSGFDNWAIDDLLIDHSQSSGGNTVPNAVVSATVVNAAIGTVELNGLFSNDPNGTISNYSWSWSGGSAVGISPRVTLPSGATIITLIVTDNLGAAGTASVTVDVNDIRNLLLQAGLSGSSAAWNATPFNDGVENLLKYAFNMNAAGPDVSVLSTGGSSGLPQISMDTSGAEPVLRVAFLRRKGSGLTYVPQRSTTLGSFVAMTGTQTITSIDAQWERVSVEEPAPLATAPHAFARVQVSLP